MESSSDNATLGCDANANKSVVNVARTDPTSSCSSDQRWLIAPVSSNVRGGSTRFQDAFASANEELMEAIRSLNGLNEKISCYTTNELNERNEAENAADDKCDEAVCPGGGGGRLPATLVLQKMLADTQAHCLRMVSNNQHLGVKLDVELQRCHTDLDTLRKDLNQAQHQMDDLETNLVIVGSQTESDNEGMSPAQELEAAVVRLREDNHRLQLQVAMLQHRLLEDQLAWNNDANAQGSSGGVNNVQPIGGAITRLEVKGLQDAVEDLSKDCDHLRTEKADLVAEIRQVYAVLEGKEVELRDFIRQYEAKMRDCDKGVKHLVVEKEACEQDRDRLESQLNDVIGRLSTTQQELSKRDDENASLRQQLLELQGRFLLLTGKPAAIARDESNESELTASYVTSPSVGYGSMPVTPGSLLTSLSNNGLINDRDDVPDDSEPPPNIHVKEIVVTAPTPKHQPTPGEWRRQSRSRTQRSSSAGQERFTLSRLLGFGRKDKREHSHTTTEIRESSSPQQDGQDALAEARRLPITHWKQSHVLAMIDLELGMGYCNTLVTQRVSSGRVLHSLTDGDLESRLKIANPMHRRKFRLAVEHYAAPHLCKYPCLQLFTVAYCKDFLAALGLTQYTAVFEQNLVDGRLLNQLNRKQLHKHLGITKKFHQTSILCGVDLLRLFNFNTEVLAARRAKCGCEPRGDLLVWTASDVRNWLVHLRLQDYLSGLHTCGLNGAVMVLEKTFSVESLLTMLQVPSSDPGARALISNSFEPLMCEARTALARLEQHSPQKIANTSAFSRSYTSGCVGSVTGEKHNNSIRGSFGRVFTKLQHRRGSDTRGKSSSPLRAHSSDTDALGSSSHRHAMATSCISSMHDDVNDLKNSSLTSTGSVSSATSDLGSSVERSQHLRTILGGVPKVLQQPPVSQTTSKHGKKSLTPQPQHKTDSLSQSTDSAIMSDAELSGSEPMKTTAASWTPKIVLREKRRTSRSQGVSTTDGVRPHSIADFAAASRVKLDRCTGDNRAAPLLSDRLTCGWLKQDHDRSKALILTPPPAAERRIGTIAEAGEYESHTDILENKPLSAGATPLKDRRALNRHRPMSMDVARFSHHKILAARLAYLSNGPGAPLSERRGPETADTVRVALSTCQSRVRAGCESPNAKSRPKSLPIKVLLDASQELSRSSIMIETDL